MTDEEYEKASDLEKILYDRTGMLAKNHPSIVEAMEEYAKLVKNHGVSHHVSESKPFDIHNCINEILQDVDRYRYSAMRFVNDGRIRYQVKRAIDKMIYSR